MVHALDIMEREGDRVHGCLNAEVSLVLESLGLDSNTNDMEHVVKKKHDREFAIEMRRAAARRSDGKVSSPFFAYFLAIFPTRF